MPAHLRLVTLNFWGLSEPLEARLALAEKQLRELAPDVVALQEVQPMPGQDSHTTAHELADRLGLQCTYAPSVRWNHGQLGASTNAIEEGLALLSRWPVLDVGRLALPEPRPADARLLLSGQFDTEVGPIWVHTTHLHYRLDDGVAREAQVLAIDEAIRSYGRNNDSPPQILCGDFNATPDSDELRFMRGLTTLGGRRTHFQDAWLRLHDEPRRCDGPAQGITWSSENENTRPLRSLDIDRRIDYVLVTSRKRDGRGTVRRAEVVLTERDDTGSCASDHYGVLAEVQIAPND